MKEPKDIISHIEKEYGKIGRPTKTEPPYYAKEFKYSSDMDIHVRKILDFLAQLLESSFEELDHVESAIKALSHTQNKEVKILDSYRSNIGPNKPKLRETEFESAWQDAKSHIMTDLNFVIHYYKGS
jgi:hypothetical protein